ncbi:hypothetical protein HZV21_005087 [Salmonella enterica]|nr:hypothetical protein [Salmonella enterica]EJI6541001.1 hypothetical protein [Salmonella enterica]EJK5562015.1 hypothetical protein [Salmonella enterica]
MKFKDLPVEVQAIAASLLKDLYIFDQQDVNEERAKNLSKAFVALYQDSSAVNSDIATESRKPIKDSIGVYDAHLGESAKNEMHSRRLKMLQVMPVLDKRISETLEENGIPGFYSLDAVRLLLAIYRTTNSVMTGPFDSYPDF